MVRQFNSSIIRDLIGEINDLTDQAVSEARKMTEENEREKASHASEDAAREKAARQGVFGPEWQRLQRRMDDGETSWNRVFLGLDEDEATQKVVTNSFDRLEAMITEARDSLADEDGEEGEALVEMNALSAEVSAQLARINQGLTDLGRG